MRDTIIKELKRHAPFTFFGAMTGVILIAFFQRMPSDISYNIFYVLHPIHVVLSALVTVSMYEFHKCGSGGKKRDLWALLAIGYFGSIGIETISDSVIPYLGEAMLGMPNKGMHIGFIEKWWLVNPLAIAGVAIAYFKPSTRFPHAGHVLLSTWASLFHMIMAVGQPVNGIMYLGIFAFLFLAVWLPCCVSDIIFPLLFVKEKEKK